MDKIIVDGVKVVNGFLPSYKDGKILQSHFYVNRDFLDEMEIETNYDLLSFFEVGLEEGKKGSLSEEEMDLLKRGFYHYFNCGMDESNIRWLRDQMVSLSVLELEIKGDFFLLNTEEKTKEVTLERLKERIIVTSQTRSSTNSVLSDWGGVKNYTYKMPPEKYKFFRTERLEDVSCMFGLELEMSTKLSVEELQQIVTTVEPKQEPFFIFKNDSSVTGKYGNLMELVTVPCSPKFLRKQLIVFFDKLEKLCEKQGKSLDDFFDLSVDLDNGLHIHVSREAFTTGSSVMKFAYWWLKESKMVLPELNKVCKRPEGLGCGRTPHIGASQEAKTSSKGYFLSGGLHSRLDRYKNVNVTGQETVEIRAYQGIFSKTHVVDCIMFTEYLVDFANKKGFSETTNPTSFLSSMKKGLSKDKKYTSIMETLTCA